MYDFDPSVWQGRVDPEDGQLGLRWHQQVQPWHEQAAAGVCLLRFATDEGVRRNQGRPGAIEGPGKVLKALANQAWHRQTPVWDAGEVRCADGNLEASQEQVGARLHRVLQQGQLPLLIGGGHEIAWASYQGLYRYLAEQNRNKSFPTIGIINFDAHFDLRVGHGQGSSGTPFWQIAEHCQSLGHPFRYACLGVNPGANTQALFQRAEELGVWYRLDSQMNSWQLTDIRAQLASFISQCDGIYLSIDLDVLPAATAPGVSAPAGRGVALELIEVLIADIVEAHQQGICPLWLADIAEYNPSFDLDGRTAKVAARLLTQLATATEQPADY
ncbi:formimidoylglutamase [Balneatrix alpica]|uniref:formimidoylglutamase n=1 Tax=Balneatrix alpica TaxID=75684 RepID=UPI0027399B4B|nr:formimidoylglutamase [Balneatrix alpica]